MFEGTIEEGDCKNFAWKGEEMVERMGYKKEGEGCQSLFPCTYEQVRISRTSITQDSIPRYSSIVRFHDTVTEKNNRLPISRFQKMPGSNSNPDSIWLYNPSLALSIVFAVVYTVPLVWQSYLTIFKYRAYYFSVVIVGAAFEVGGYMSRAVSIKKQESIVRRNPLLTQPLHFSPFSLSNYRHGLFILFFGGLNG